MIGISLLAAGALWFYADFDRPFLVDGKVYDAPMRKGGFIEGKFGKGYSFVADGKIRKGDFLCISDNGVLAGFPWESGSFSCLYRLPEGRDVPKTMPFWGFGGLWQYQWGWTGGSFYTEYGNGRAKSARIKFDDWKPARDWRHFCATWNADEIVCYCDGRRVATQKRPVRADLRELARKAFWLGSKGDGSEAANVEVDEVAIFTNALSAEEVGKLAAATEPIVDDAAFFGGHVDFPIYWRNQEDAALRMKLWSPKDETLTAELKVGGRLFPAKSVVAKKGIVRLAVPFDPALYKAGLYRWELTVRDAAGQDRFSDAGELEIRARVERDAFKFLSWGGPTVPAISNLVMLGINDVNNIKAGERDQAVRDYLRHDLFVNFRLENSKEWEKYGLDPKRIARSAAAWLEPAMGLHLWATTLVNSEVYQLGKMNDLTNAVLAAQCKAAIGIEPELSFVGATDEFDYAKKGIEPYRGVMPDDDPSLRTFRWYRGDAFKACQMNRASAQAIRLLSPGNIVWSEPNPPPAGLDMLAAWIYDYETDRTLVKLRKQYAYTRAKGVKNMPTLGMCYFSPLPPHPKGEHPTAKDKDGKPLKVKIAQSCDELTIKSWMMIGGVRCDAVSYYEIDTWERGAAGTRTWQANPDAPVKFIGETDAIARFGRFQHAHLAPAAELLRGIDADRLPIGVVLFDEVERAGGWKWSHQFYGNQIGDALTRMSYGCDWLRAEEISAETLAKYRYLIVPMLNVVTVSHDALLRKLPKSVVLITDAHAETTYPNAVCLKDMKYAVTTKDRGPGAINRKGVDEPLARFLSDKADELHGLVTAWSETDGKSSYTLSKAYKGVKFVTVVNDARRAGGTPMNMFNTNAWYRPCGAPQRIVTHLNARGHVYEFNAEGRAALGRVNEIVGDYAPGEGRLYCIYPRPLEKIAVSFEGTARRGTRASLRIAVTDAKGKAPGRQVVRVTVTDPTGAETEESGRYSVEDGVGVVPLRFAALSDGDAALGTWKVRVRELTSGLECGTSFVLE